MTKTSLLQISVICTSVALLGLIACYPPAPASLAEEDLAAIKAIDQAWTEGARANDWASVAALYAEDAVLMPPNKPVVTGRGNIQEEFESTPSVTAVNLEVNEIDGLGGLAYVRGSYTLTMSIEGVGAITDSGKYMDIRRKQADGSWLIIRDIYNSDLGVPKEQ